MWSCGCGCGLVGVWLCEYGCGHVNVTVSMGVVMWVWLFDVVCTRLFCCAEEYNIAIIVMHKVVLSVYVYMQTCHTKQCACATPIHVHVPHPLMHVCHT